MAELTRGQIESFRDGLPIGGRANPVVGMLCDLAIRGLEQNAAGQIGGRNSDPAASDLELSARTLAHSADDPQGSNDAMTRGDAGNAPSGVKGRVMGTPPAQSVPAAPHSEPQDLRSTTTSPASDSPTPACSESFNDYMQYGEYARVANESPPTQEAPPAGHGRLNPVEIASKPETHSALGGDLDALVKRLRVFLAIFDGPVRAEDITLDMIISLRDAIDAMEEKP